VVISSLSASRLAAFARGFPVWACSVDCFGVWSSAGLCLFRPYLVFVCFLCLVVGLSCFMFVGLLRLFVQIVGAAPVSFGSSITVVVKGFLSIYD